MERVITKAPTHCKFEYMSKPLENIRIVDIGRYVAGPYCATLLGALGADVIRVERPDGGEDRFISPLSFDDSGQPGEGGLIYQTGWGKKSLSLNLSDESGREILGKLVATADIVVANLPPAALKRLGLDWETLYQRHPEVILVTQTGFGDIGPDSTKGGFDGIGQAMSGAMYLTGTPGNPAKAGAPYVDYATALMSAFATMAALMEREKTGQGQHVQTSLLNTALAVMNAHLIEQGVTGINRVGTGNRVQTSAPSDVFATSDGHILVHTVGNNLFKRWAETVGKSELVEDDRFQSDQHRGDHNDVLCDIMATWCAQRTTSEALSMLQEKGVPSGPVLSLQQALDNPQVDAMSYFTSVAVNGMEGTFAPVLGLPAQFSSLTPNAPTAPPEIGGHNAEILSELGLSEAQIEELEAQGII